MTGATRYALACFVVASARVASAEPPPPNLPPPPPPRGGTSDDQTVPPPPPQSTPSQGAPSRPRRGAPPSRAPKPASHEAAAATGEERAEDANVDRVLLTPTAETQPKGAAFVSAYAPVIGQLGYAFTDSIQASVAVAAPFPTKAFVLDMTVKAKVLRRGPFRVAVILGGDRLADTAEFQGAALGMRFGGVGQLCFERRCRHSFSIDAEVSVTDRGNAHLPMFVSGGLIVQASQLVKILLEPMYEQGASPTGLTGQSGFVFGYGLRFSTRRWGLDVALLKGTGELESGPVVGLPWAAFTYRFGGR